MSADSLVKKGLSQTEEVCLRTKILLESFKCSIGQIIIIIIIIINSDRDLKSMVQGGRGRGKQHGGGKKQSARYCEPLVYNCGRKDLQIL